MALAELNGLPVIRGHIHMPQLGAWTADLVVDTETDVTGAVTLTLDGGLRLVGFAVRGGQFQATEYIRVIGGAGGLVRQARVQHYRNTTVRAVVSDLVRAAGESLSNTADSSVLALQLLAWTQLAQPVAAALTSIASDRRHAGAVAWRVLADGTIWIGRETWPDAGLKAPADYQELVALPSEGWVDLGFEVPRVVPGVSLEGRRLSFVQHSIDGETVRTKAWVAAG
ncbi:MAG: hypothetical protein EPN98_21505 [Phenylobacterium sp.]|uniref:hypothetical protein n=1 Tax=Phenylobacterium sp. TaxID=1871053 RepID=UPI0011FA4443|nr:hypothetical protein [Phenylobacterium sp.]TAL29022.1 MAG: hypothetical protein EPN98_21505 [Phenylobacterium sp.]